MRKLLLAIVVSVVLFGIASPSYAASPHFKGGDPSFTDTGLRLASSGALAGLGNGDLEVRLTATGNPTSTCTNPSGSNQPPGQNPASVTLTGLQPIPANSIKNGNATFSVQTAAPQSPVPGAPGCPNRRWTQTITDVAFTSASLDIRQDQGFGVFVTVLTFSCSFSPPTSDGPAHCA